MYFIICINTSNFITYFIHIHFDRGTYGSVNRPGVISNFDVNLCYFTIINALKNENIGILYNKYVVINYSVALVFFWCYFIILNKFN